jgi:hypothetical protein
MSNRNKLWVVLIGTLVVVITAIIQYAEGWTVVKHTVEALRSTGSFGDFLANTLISPGFSLVLAVVLLLILIDTWRRLRELEEREKAGRAETGAVDARTKTEIYRIDWSYLPASPLEHGWTLAYQEIPTPTVKFLAPLDSPEPGGLRLDVNGKYAIDFKVPTDYAVVDELALAIRYGEGAMFWVAVNVTSLDGVSERKSHFLKILVGDKAPESPKEWPDETLVWMIPDPLPNNWRGFRLRLTDVVTKALGSRGYIYESTMCIRLRGCISITPVKFLSTVPSQPAVMLPS